MVRKVFLKNAEYGNKIFNILLGGRLGGFVWKEFKLEESIYAYWQFLEGTPSPSPR